MGNVVLGYGNLVDSATLTAGIGSWSANAPLANIQDSVVAVAARSTDATTASTKLQLDLGAAKAASVLMLSGVNLSAAAQVRIRCGSVSGMGSGVIYDSGTISVWPTGSTADVLARHTRWTPSLVFGSKTARYWLIEFTDTANADGYVQLGRVFLGPSFQPAVNAIYGARARWINRNTRDVSYSGVIYTSRRPPQRESSFAFDGLSRAEALESIAQLQVISADSTEVALVFDPADSSLARLYESFLGEVHEFDPTTYLAPGRYGSGFIVKERL